MDFQSFIDSYLAMSCVISIEKKNDGEYGDIRIVAGNKVFCFLAEHPPFEDSSNFTPVKFVPNCPYDRYLPKTSDFEDMCYRAAVQKKSAHSYVHLGMSDQWVKTIFIPLDYEDGNFCYCTYTAENVDAHEIEAESFSSMSVTGDVLKTCIKFRSSTDFRTTVNEVLNDLRNICGAQSCTIALVEPDEARFEILSQSVDDNCISIPHHDYGNFYDITTTWEQLIGESDCIIVKDEQDKMFIKENAPEWYESLEQSNIDNVIVFPLRHNKELLGYIWALNFNTDNTSRIKDVLELTVFFISSEVASYKMMKRLEHISFTDLLTGVYNRNAMNNRISEIVAGHQNIKSPYGIVFVDINGLKRVNDEQGHASGDLLLKKAALTLQEVFTEDDIYRAGGDEFMIMVSNSSKEAFLSKVETLKLRCNSPDNVCFSIGYFFNDKATSIHDVMHIADEEMFKDKERYYREHPEQKYR